MAKRYAKKLLVIGWDAADWKVIWPLIREGKMPTLAKLIQEGSWGNVATLDPPLSPMLWTSMATGKRPFDHGILGFIEPMADGSGVQPSTSTSRTCKAFWNMLNQKGIKSNVIAWWPSHPAEPISGAMVSNFFQQHKGPMSKPWPMMEGTVHPTRLHDEMKRLRYHPEEMTQAHILPFIPKAAEINQEEDKRMEGVAKIIAHCGSVQAATTYLMENEDWEVTACYFDGIDHFSHLAMKFHPPRMEGIPEDQFELYKDVVTSGYRLHDMMLERQLELAGEDCNVILISDHGFHSDHLRPRWLPLEPAAPALEHSPYGIIVMKGNGIKSGGEQIFGASILDLTPTILAMMGEPVGEDMHGKVLTQAFEDDFEPETIPTWEDVTEGEDGRHPEDAQEDKWASAEAMEQLVQLGYVDAPDGDTAKQVFDAKCESQYYLARAYVNGGRFKEAIEIYEQLIKDKPEEHRFAHKLAHVYLQTRRFRKLRLLIDGLRDWFANFDPASIDKEVEDFVPKEDLPEKKKEELIKRKKENAVKRKQQLERDKVYVEFLSSLHAMAVNRPRKAMDYLKIVEEKAPNSPEVYMQMGKICQVRQRWADSEDAYIKALAMDSTNAAGHHGLGIAYLRQNKLEEAADELLTAIEHLYYMPSAHYHLGEALYKLGKFEEAEGAFRVAVSMAPGMTKAHKWLVRLYENELSMPEKATEHNEFLDNNIKGEITVVSGLPRSGTSMMMQMLDKGGMEILTDGNREADNNNPKGYYEYDPVKKLAMDKSWMGEASGKAVKIIAQLVGHLPDKFNYKIIFMDREISEVLASQQIMLGKEDHVEAKAFPVGLAETFKKQVEKMDAWVESQANIEIMRVNYSDVINNPEEEAENICAFLGQSLDIKAMAEVVDPNLYRNKMEPQANNE